MKWVLGDPPRHGYYLATWVRDDDGAAIVSELWFNPDSCRSKWWASRGYLGQNGSDAGNGGAVYGVIAHAPMPAPYQP